MYHLYLVTISPENNDFPFEGDSFNVPVEYPSPHVESAVKIQSFRLEFITNIITSGYFVYLILLNFKLFEP